MHLNTPDPKRPRISQLEFVAVVGLLMALNALSIDIFLPALDEIGHELGAPGNERQWVVTAYMVGFGLGQLFMGPLSDALGRRQILLVSLIAFATASLLCATAPFMGFMLAARFLQGLAAAGTRVIATAAVRDLVSGRRMAQIMSFAMTVFTIAPVLAPAIGELVAYVSHWRMIFAVLVVYGAGLSIWLFIRMPETLTVDHRIGLNIGAAAKAYGRALQSRLTLGYTLAACMVFGALFVYIGTSEQLIAELYGLEHWFALAFAIIAIGLGGAAILNASIVRRYGMRRISHFGLAVFVVINLVHTVIASFGNPPFFVFFGFLMCATMLFSVIAANFSALVMEPAGTQAGTVGALYGAVTSTVGAILGGVIGQFYNDTVFPIALGFSVLGVLGLVIVFLTEPDRMFGVGETIGDEAD